MVQGKKMKTPRELYCECLDEGGIQEISIPRVGYVFLMDMRKKAAQATIDYFAKPMLTSVTKNSHGCYSESDTSFCEEQDASNSNSPSPDSLRDFINALPHFEPLHFGFYLMTDDKRASCLCPCLRGVSSWRSSFKIDFEKKGCCKFHLLQSNGLLQNCQAKDGYYHSCIVYSSQIPKLDLNFSNASNRLIY